MTSRTATCISGLAGWLTLADIAHNMLRAADCLASPRQLNARAATIRADLHR